MIPACFPAAHSCKIKMDTGATHPVQSGIGRIQDHALWKFGGQEKFSSTSGVQHFWVLHGSLRLRILDFGVGSAQVCKIVPVIISSSSFDGIWRLQGVLSSLRASRYTRHTFQKHYIKIKPSFLPCDSIFVTQINYDKLNISSISHK